MADAETSRRSGFLTAPFVLLCAFYFLVFAAGYQLFPVVPLHLRDLGASLAESGRFQTAFMLGSGFGSLFTGPLGDRLGQRRVLLEVYEAFKAAHSVPTPPTATRRGAGRRLTP